jgi:hypothetical protein
VPTIQALIGASLHGPYKPKYSTNQLRGYDTWITHYYVDLTCFHQSKFASLKTLQLGTKLGLVGERSPCVGIFSIPNCNTHKWETIIIWGTSYPLKSSTRSFQVLLASNFEKTPFIKRSSWFLLIANLSFFQKKL